MVTKHVNPTISPNETGVHVVDFPKSPFDESLRYTWDSTLIFNQPAFDRKKLSSFVMNQFGAPHVNLYLELWTMAEFTTFILSLACRQTEHISRRLIPSFFSAVRKLIVSKPHPLFSRTRTISV
jgi:hypothetical protein